MAKIHKSTTRKRKKVLRTQVPIQPRLQPLPFLAPQPYIPYYYHWPTPPILQLQSKLQSQEARINQLQSQLVGREEERTVQLEAAIKEKDEEIENKDERIRELSDLQAKDEATKQEMQAKLTELERKLAECEERIVFLQDDLTKHKVHLLKLATSIYTSLRRMYKPK